MNMYNMCMYMCMCNHAHAHGGMYMATMCISIEIYLWVALLFFGLCVYPLYSFTLVFLFFVY